MTDKKLNILFLSSWYPNRIMPTLGNFVQKHAESVALKSNVIALFVCSDSNMFQTYEVVESTINNVYTINVYYKKVKHSIPLFSQIIKGIRIIKAYSAGLKIVNQKFKKINFVHHNILFPVGIIAWYLKKFKGIPYIITENWTGYLPSKNIKQSWIQKKISRIIARNAECITPVSADLRDAMIGLGLKSNYEIIYNVTDTNVFYPVKEKIKKNKIKILHISTLVDAHKNISGMLRATERLSKMRDDFEVWFIGDGDVQPHILSANELGIYNKFAFFDGTKTTDEVATLMRSSECLLLFSNYENLPCVLTEALATGIPIVSSMVGGISEHINNNFGILVPRGDEESLLNALNNVIDNIRTEKYNSDELRSYAIAHFSYEQIGEKFQNLYQHLLANRN